MKKMTCRELGGACDMEFTTTTFEEMVAQSKAHGTEMFIQKDADHLAAMEKMQLLMQSPTELQKWFGEKRKAFEALPNLEQ